MAVLADGGKNFGRNPTLEALGRFELGAEDQSVEARLVDAVDGLDSVELISDFRFDEIVRIHMTQYSVLRVLIAKSSCNVDSDEERKVGGTERTHGVVLEREAESLHESLRIDQS